jgi:hypothetical protein
MAAPNLPEPVPGVAVDPVVLERLVAQLETTVLRANHLLPRDVLRSLAYAAVAQLAPVYAAKGAHDERNRYTGQLLQAQYTTRQLAIAEERARCAKLADDAHLPVLALAIRTPAPERLPGCIPSFRHDDATRPPGRPGVSFLDVPFRDHDPRD